MATSVVQICNRGLQKLGAKRITSLSEDSVNARACNVAYEAVKRAELRAHQWVCAIKRAEIAADSDEPEWGRAASYTLPSDWLRNADDYAEDNSNAKDWQIEGRKILTDDSAPLYLRYIYDVTDPNEMDSLLSEAISTRLALELCEELTQSNTKKDVLKDDYKLIIKEARRVNAIERRPIDPPDDEWITSRR